MIDIIVYLLMALTFMPAAVWLNDYKLMRAESGSGAGLRCLRITRKEAIVLSVFGMVGGVFLAKISQVWYETDRIQGLANVFVNSWLLAAAWSDHKSRKVSNRWILYGLSAAFVFSAVELVLDSEKMLLFVDRLFGVIAGSGILFAGAMFCRGGIGMGDVKVFLVLGLFWGADTVFAILLITLILALIAGGMQIICGRAGRKARLPLCPFAYVAMILTVLCGF